MRVAVYFTTPEDAELTRLASRWLGRDAFTGRPVQRPAFDLIADDDLDQLTEFSRRYGWHATITAPFPLKDRVELPEIRDEMRKFCQRDPFQIPNMNILSIGKFFALIPDPQNAEIVDLAADANHAFNPFRQPLSKEELQKKCAGLDEKRQSNLREFGYAPIFDLFRFHMTLAGPVPEDKRRDVRTLLDGHFQAYLGKPLVVDRLALFVERETPGPFVIDSVYEFSGKAS